eukprot:gene24755-biopygen16448
MMFGGSHQLLARVLQPPVRHHTAAEAADKAARSSPKYGRGRGRAQGYADFLWFQDTRQKTPTKTRIHFLFVFGPVGSTKWGKGRGQSIVETAGGRAGGRVDKPWRSNECLGEVLTAARASGWNCCCDPMTFVTKRPMVGKDEGLLPPRSHRDPLLWNHGAENDRGTQCSTRKRPAAPPPQVLLLRRFVRRRPHALGDARTLR